MSTEIRLRGDIEDVNIESITFKRPKLIKKVSIPEGTFDSNKIFEVNHYSIITVPGTDVEFKIIGTKVNKNRDFFYKNYKIKNVVFNSDEDDSTVSMSFETDIEDIYRIEIISQEKTSGNMINPGKIIKKIYILDYKFNLNEKQPQTSDGITILKSNVDSEMAINALENNDDDDNDDDDDDDADEDEDELEEDNDDGEN